MFYHFLYYNILRDNFFFLLKIVFLHYTNPHTDKSVPMPILKLQFVPVMMILRPCSLVKQGFLDNHIPLDIKRSYVKQWKWPLYSGPVLCTEMKILSFWSAFNYWHWKLSKWQLLVQPEKKMSPKRSRPLPGWQDITFVVMPSLIVCSQAEAWDWK